MRGRLPAVTLAYHGIDRVADADDPKFLILRPERLEAHVRLLRRLGYRFRTASQLLDEGPARGAAVLTFDDGWRSWLSVAAPLLRRLDAPATFFVNPGRWGGRSSSVRGEAGRFLDEAEARRLHELGMELGSHSLSHPDLRTLDDVELARELKESKAAVERITGEPCRTFAYPYGLFDERVERAVAAAGYELAFAWRRGPWRPLAAPRIPAPARRGAGVLALKLLGLR